MLVGTTSIEDSSLVSELLVNEGVPHKVLNAKPEVAERESEIISQAGRQGAVTIPGVSKRGARVGRVESLL